MADISTNAVIVIIAILLFGFGMIYEGLDTSDTMSILEGIAGIIIGIAGIMVEKPQIKS
jgi:hypothetical protein